MIGRAGVLISRPFPLVPKFPSRGNFGDDGHVAFGTSQGFLNFPKIKYLGGDSVIWQSSPVLGLFDSNRFSKRFTEFGLFVDYQFHIALCEIRFKTVTGVQTVGPIRALRKGARKKSSYSFWLLCWGFRELDSNS